jgi:hypothetical protein
VMNLHAWVLQLSRVKSHASLQWIDIKQTISADTFIWSSKPAEGWLADNLSLKKSRHKTRKWWPRSFSNWSRVKSKASAIINMQASCIGKY